MSKLDYLDIKEAVRCEQEIRKSRFLTYLLPIRSEEEAKEALKAIKKEHPKATHHCSAFICNDIIRSNDDGEPSSTAGLPILSVLSGTKLNHVICVVVRYYGGTLLGVGGLIQAYSSSAQQAVSQAIFLKPLLITHVECRFPYDQINAVESSLSLTSTIEDRRYQEFVIYDIQMQNPSDIDVLIENTNGQITCTFTGESIQMKEEIL